MRSHRHRYAVVILLLLVALIAGACGGDEEEGEPSRPTIPVFPSATPRITQISEQPTALPTTALGPTPTRFQGFPTLSAPPTQPRTYPNIIQIVSPVSGQQLSGSVPIFGSASHPSFVQYTVEYGPFPNPSGLWYPITPQAVTVPVINGVLGTWNTNTVPDGNYQIRLHVYLNTGQEITNVVISSLRVQNNVLPPTVPVNTNPSITPIAPLNLIRGTSATIALGIYDADGDPTTFIATSDNTSVATVSPSGQAITVTGVRAGIATIRVRVSDNRSGTTETSFLVTVAEPQTPNSAPNIEPIPGQTLSQGATINVPVNITDAEGDSYDFTVNSASTTIAGVSKGADGASINIAGFTPGTTTVVVTATDSRNASRSIAFAVVVNPRAPDNNPPSISAIPGQTVEEGTSKTVGLSINDPEGDRVTYTLLSSNPAVVGVSDQGNNTIRITGNSPGSASVTVTVRDARGASASTVFSVTVTEAPPPNQQPTIAAIPAQTVEAGKTIQVDLSMSDPDGDTLTFSSTSGDTNIATTAQVDEDTLSVTGVAEGTTTITVSVGDGKGGSASTTFNVTVAPAVVPNNPPSLQSIGAQSIEVGKTLLVNLNYTDPDGDSLTVTATADDSSIATVFQSAPFELTVTGASAGNTNISVTVDDGRGGTDSVTFPVTVQPANQNPTIEPIVEQTCSVGDTLTLTLNYSDPDGDTVRIAPTSDNQSVATASFDGNTTLTVNCLAEGTATVTLTLDDQRGGQIASSFLVNVGAANQNPIIQPIADQTCQANQGVQVALSYSDPDGDTVTVAPISGDPGIAFPQMLDTVNLGINCIAEGTATITVNVDDGNGGTASTSFTVTVSAAPPPNQNPIIQPIADQTCQVGQGVQVALSYSDPDGDTVSVAPTSSDTGIAFPQMLDDVNLGINCIAEGTATITVNVDDGNGGTASTSFTIAVSAAPPPNQNPVIQPTAPQTCQPGTNLPVRLIYSDPDGDDVTVTTSSDNSTVATATMADANTLVVACGNEGFANIMLNLDDGRGGTASTSFGVTVSAPAPVNQNPTIQPIGPQSCTAGDVLPVALSYSDPDGDTVTVTPTSDNSPVAFGTMADATTLNVTCAAEGFANIMLNLDDGRGGTASTTFGVTVSAPAPVNQNPTIQPVGPQSCTAGDVLTLPLSYSDPDGDTVTVTPTSDNSPVAFGTMADATTLNVTCAAEGFANIMLNLDDGRGGTASTTFGVTVNAPAPVNQNPTIQPVGPQSCTAGDVLPVPLSYSDPDGDDVIVMPTSDNSTVASAAMANATTLNVTCAAEGFANIMLNLDDGRGGTASTTFGVTVSAPANQNPTIQPIADQICLTGEVVNVGLSYNDPDGDTVTVSPSSSDPSIANPVMADASTLSVTCGNQGNASITLNLNDGRGGFAAVGFNVTVSGPVPPPFDVSTYPEIPDIGPLMGGLGPVHSDGINNLGIQPNAFSIAGDDSITAPNFQQGITQGLYNLGNYTNLNDTITFFNFDFESAAIGNGWQVGTLLDPGAADPNVCQGGETPLACELRLRAPSYIFINFKPSNAVATPIDTFRAQLEQVVDQALNAGSIPVLVTLPDDGAVDSGTLSQYNQVIVEVATQHSGHPDLDVPLWNLYNTMQGAINGVYAASPTGPVDFSDRALGFGVNRRNLAALRILEALRLAFP